VLLFNSVFFEFIRLRVNQRRNIRSKIASFFGMTKYSRAIFDEKQGSVRFAAKKMAARL